MLSRRELIAERAARRALHESLIASEADFAAARSGYVEIGFAYQQRAEFGFAERPEELCEPGNALCRIPVLPHHGGAYLP